MKVKLIKKKGGGGKAVIILPAPFKVFIDSSVAKKIIYL